MSFPCKHRNQETHGAYRWCTLCGSVKHHESRHWRRPLMKRKTFIEMHRKVRTQCSDRDATPDGGFYICLRNEGHWGPHKAAKHVWKKR